MKYSVSNLPFVGYELYHLQMLPAEVGIEVFGEYGNDYYWKHYLPRVLEGRTGGFSVHGPFCRLDLADEDCLFDEVERAYRQSFSLCQNHNAAFCVCHPCEIKPSYPKTFDIRAGEERAILRIEKLAKIAKEYGTRLAVENLAHPRSMFGEGRYVSAFLNMPDVGYLIDIGHALTRDWDLPSVLSILHERIVGYHVHDNDGEHDTHSLVGTGVMDWKAFMRAYQKYTPEAPLVLEYAKASISDMADGIRYLNACADTIPKEEEIKDR